MTVAARIEDKLARALSPESLTVVNDSDRHAGHASSPGTGESHFSVAVVAAAFEGLGRVERQRRVYDLLAEELSGPVHALSLRLETPAEAERRG